jgi:hypothetical protein
MRAGLVNHWRDVLARLPLPMLALAASYGVWSFQALFVPLWVAAISAAAFELTYIGLAVVRLDEPSRRRAAMISVGAVVVSVLYNTLAALLHIRPALLDARPLWADIALAVLHGAPLAWLAWLVADLLLHSNGTERAPTAMPALSFARPAAPPAYPTPRRVRECPRCGSELTPAEYGAYRRHGARWKGCKSCKPA